MSVSTLGVFLVSRRFASTAERQSGVSCCSDADRIATIVASIRGRAKLGLQASSLLSKRIRRLNLGRRLVVVVEELIEVVVFKDAVVVVSHTIKEMIELVDGREDPVLKDVKF